jgi:maltose alpha-D-glucosyltransferase/alpha-amylase
VLFTGKDFVLTDLNDFRAVTMAERRRKRSPLRDLAWMVRSFEFAAFKVLFDPARVRETDLEAARPWGAHWTSWVSASFLQGYLTAAKEAPFMPSDAQVRAALFDAFLLERALYQLQAALEEGSAGVTILLAEIARTLA